ncbi:Gfo/Idh/MocA family oxidoreductase [Pseudonocardia sichuanensis]
MSRPWRIVVAGTNFGRVHARGVRSAPAEFTLAGILSRGSDRSAREAAALRVPHLTCADEVPDDVDAVCVAVGSAVSGGRGTELACALLERGIAVLAEHPMHPDELTQCLRTARRHRTGFRLTTHYPHVRPVRTFLDAASRLRARQAPLFVDAATPVHVLQPFLDVLGRALGGVRPWAFGDPAPDDPELTALTGRDAPLRTVAAVVAGVPVTLRVHNELHPGDRDNHALLWHRIAIGTEGGVLTLADTHGPVLWSPRFHSTRDADHRLVLDGPGLAHPSTSVAAPAGTLAEAVATLWPDAVVHALRGLRTAVEQGVDPLRDGQRDLTVARMWTDLVTRLGPPRSIRPAPPEVLGASEVLGAPEAPGISEARSPSPAPGTGGHGAYGATAEFYELAAAGSPEIAQALAGVDPHAGTVVEIGAGSGLVTAAIAAALPGARILASEPSTVLRSVLTSRVVRDPDLRERVTVRPDTAQELALPERISAAVLCGVAGHLDQAERADLWRRLTERMLPGAPLVVELMAVDRPVAMPRTRLATRRVGGQDYEWWFAARPGAGEGDPLVLHSTWRVLDAAGSTVREETETHRWHAFGLERVAAETGWELRALRGGPGANSAPLGVFTRAS